MTGINNHISRHNQSEILNHQNQSHRISLKINLFIKRHLKKSLFMITQIKKQITEIKKENLLIKITVIKSIIIVITYNP